MKKVNGQSLNPQEELVKQLKENFPEVFSENGKVDPEKLKLTLGEDIELSREKYGLSWAGKSDCFREIQKTTTATLVPQRDESVNFDETENIFIEGENLETLRVLQKSYYGKVKMIYIDPPYNTGNDFVYNDSFKQNKKEYQEQIGETNENGDLSKDTALLKNARDNGHYHSNWLNMMYPRLFLARNLLRRDGVIFVSIDDNEVQNLRMIMNEIFGEENFITQIVWEKKTGASDANDISTITEYVLVYAKSKFDSQKSFKKNYESYDIDRYKLKDKYYSDRGPYYIDNLDRGGLRYSDSLNYKITSPDGKSTFPNGRTEFVNDGWIWKWSKEKVKWGIENGFIVFKQSKNKKSGLSVYYKNYLKVDNNNEPIERAAPRKNLIVDVKNADGANDIKKLFNNKIFDYPKPKKYLMKLIDYVLFEDKDIILDFFAGSSTTAHAVMDLNEEDGGNRKFIMVQLDEETDKDSEAYKAGYKNIAEIAKERIRRAGKKLTDGGKQLGLEEGGNRELDIGFKAFKLSSSNFKEWNTEVKTEEELQQQLEAFVSNGVGDATDMAQIYELLLKNGYDLNSKVEAKEVKDPHSGEASPSTGDVSKKVYLVNGGELIICLEGVLERDIVDEIVKLEPAKVIFLETCFNNDDELKTNTLLQMESADIDFRVV